MSNANIPYVPPTFKSAAFNCPHCRAFAKQDWWTVNAGAIVIGGLLQSVCSNCERWALWFAGQMIFPPVSNAPFAHADMPDDVRVDFDEARTIVMLSPRGAAALLRLAIQKLCKDLGEPGENINADVAALVKKGLPPKVQKSMDIVRVTGNSAVHPGILDLRDDVDAALRLFDLVNLVVEVMIAQPKHVDELYKQTVPENLRQAIEKRDGGK